MNEPVHDRFASSKAKKKRLPTKRPAVKADPKKTARAVAKRKVVKKAHRKVNLKKVAVELEPLARKIQVRFDQANKAETRADDHRVAAAIHLAEAEVACKRLKISFQAWTKATFKQSYGELRRLVVAGNSNDPTKAIADLRAGAAQRMAKARAKTKALPPPTLRTPIDVATEALSALGDAATVGFITERAKHLGLVVVSKTDAVNPETIEKRFDGLGASAKMKFLAWAAESVGAKVEHGFDSKGDGMTIPAHMRRSAAVMP
jgi:hypothetical protein